MEAFSIPTITVPSPPVVSDEEFKLFHSVDRNLYYRLIHDLGRDPNESINVMGFLMWLEQYLIRDMNIIFRMLSLSPSFINGAVEEISFCLRLIEVDQIQPQYLDRELPLLQNLVRKKLTVKDFHVNRLEVYAGVSKLVNEVCVRAFRGILQNVFEKKLANQHVFKIGQNSGLSGNRGL